MDRSWIQLVGWAEAFPVGTPIKMSADTTVCTRLAEDLDVEGIESLVADLQVVRWLDGLEAKGVLRARVIRICGVSLDPFEEMIEEPFTLRFLPEGSPNAPSQPEGDVELDLDADEPPDCVAGDAIDLGHYLAEQLALALSPFPRKPGVEFQSQTTSGSTSPFAALAHLKPVSPAKRE